MAVQPVMRVVLAFGISGVLSVLTLVGHFRLWQGTLDVPLEYTSRGDALFNYMVVKTVLEESWVHENRSLGAPGKMTLYDFPMTNDLNLLAIKVLGWFYSDAFHVVNLFYLGTFVVATWTALFAFLKCGVSGPLAVSGALTFGFLPYHFHRGQNHLFLSAYMAIPLAGLVSLWVADGRSVFFHPDPTRERPRFRFGLDAVIAVATCVLLAGSDVYYAFFGAFLMVTAGLIAALRPSTRWGALDALLLVGLITGLFFLSISPCLIHGWRFGFNSSPTDFGYIQADVYGLRIANLLKPAPGHWIYTLVSPGYTQPPSNENRYSYLGIPGVLGFLMLLVALLMDRPRAARLFPLEALSRLNIATVLLGTTGGFGLLFAGMIASQIRAYNRVCILIAFYSILALLLVLEALRDRMATATSRRVLTASCVTLLLLTGLVSQAPITSRPNYQSLTNSFNNDKEFISEVESALTPGAMVFQLPYLTMPEVPVAHRRTGPFTHLRGYLHSHHLRWSYGAIHGRPTASWQQKLAETPPRKMIAPLREAGFAGIYLDRRGYRSSELERMESEFREVLRQEPIVSRNGRFLFFRLPSEESGAAGGESASRSG